MSKGLTVECFADGYFAQYDFNRPAADLLLNFEILNL